MLKRIWSKLICGHFEAFSVYCTYWMVSFYLRHGHNSLGSLYFQHFGLAREEYEVYPTDYVPLLNDLILFDRFKLIMCKIQKCLLCIETSFFSSFFLKLFCLDFKTEIYYSCYLSVCMNYYYIDYYGMVWCWIHNLFIYLLNFWRNDMDDFHGLVCFSV